MKKILKKKRADDNEPLTRGEFRAAIYGIEGRIDGIEGRIDGIERRMDGIEGRMDNFERRMDNFERTFATKVDLDNAMTNMKNYVDRGFYEIKEQMYTKEDHAKFMVWMEEAMTELRDSRDSRVLNDRHLLQHDDKLVNHEKRICVLERK